VPARGQASPVAAVHFAIFYSLGDQGHKSVIR
jgi:hypothetical protein